MRVGDVIAWMKEAPQYALFTKDLRSALGVVRRKVASVGLCQWMEVFYRLVLAF